jgi:hypothetical protein
MNTTASEATAQTRLPIYSVGGIVFASVLGGPVAAGFLTQQNLRRLGAQSNLRAALFVFGALVVFWLYVAHHTPNDPLSYFLMNLPQFILWWQASYWFTRTPHRTFRTEGGIFTTKWRAFGVGLRFWALLFVLFYIGRYISQHLQATPHAS